MPIGGKTKLFGSHPKELLTKEKIVSFYINGKLFKGIISKNYFEYITMRVMYPPNQF